MIHTIPDELKAKHQWVCWGSSPDGPKVPVNARTRGNADTTNPDTWSSYEEACMRVLDGQEKGIGFVFTGDYVAVDLDDAFTDDELKPWAREIVDSIGDAYSEISPSGKGLHLILPYTTLPGKGLGFKFSRNNYLDGIGGVEIYSTGRYFTMTGDHRGPCTIRGDGENVLPIYAKFTALLGRKKESLPKGTADDVFSRIQAAVDTSEVFAHYGHDIGRDHKLCCPWHEDGTPSLHVYPDGSWYCYGCQLWGDAITAVKLFEEFPNAYKAAKRLDEIFGLGIFEAATKTMSVADAITMAVESAEPAQQDELQKILEKAFNLADVERPDDSKVVYIKTGTPTLDNRIQGLGLGQMTVVTGHNASGKSTWLGQVMVECLEQGEKVFAFSGELIPYKFQEWIDLQAAGPGHVAKHITASGFELFRAQADAVRKIHEWYRDRFWLFDNNHGMGINNLIEVMTAFAVHKRVRVFLLDNLMRLDLSTLHRDEYLAQSRFINELSNFAQQKQVHVICVAHPRKTFDSLLRKQDISGSGDLTNRADNVICVHRVTEDLKGDYQKTYPKRKQQQDMLNHCDNTLEVFKNRDHGVCEIMFPLLFDHDTKRLYDGMHPELKDRRYGWDIPADTRKPF